MTSPFDRAWPRRPFVSPARWMPEAPMGRLWKETSVTFSRGGDVPTPGGGFDRGSGPTDYLTAYCHVETDTSNDPISSETGGVLSFYSWWTIFLPVVIDDVALNPGQYPRRGDRVTFTDDTGKVCQSFLRDVVSPDTVLDHFECMSEVWT